ncbi:hypothetical protein SUGI_1030700 [Cryptomeria japonica]|nr:hypothetical protein SUGI_1030700 [Cryptomeria japonica]
MRMLYLIGTSSFLSLFIFFTGVSASNMTNDSVNSSYTYPKLLGSGIQEIKGEACSKENVLVINRAIFPMSSGIPLYSANIMNVCRTGCSIAEIHLPCGWISSARQINPKLFKRLKYNDCLVNDGKPLKPSGSISIQYANTFKYPMEVSYVKCLT